MDSQAIVNTDNTSNDNILKDIGENDQPTFEQPQQHSTVEPTKEMQAQRELIDEALSVSEKLKEAVSPTIKNDKGHVEKKRQEVKNIENPFKNLNYKATQLIFWENPAQSGSLLAVGLSILIFTAYYSLFNTFCAFAVMLMGANWVYVMGRKQLQSLINQKPINPHEHLLNTPWYIEREDLEKHLDSIINTANFLLVEAQRILLVDDPMRTIRHVIMFYILWTLGTWISLRTLFGIGLVLSFSTPIAYQKNKAFVDEKLHQSNKLFQSYYEHGLDVAKQHTGGAYEKAKSFAVTKGLVKEE